MTTRCCLTYCFVILIAALGDPTSASAQWGYPGGFGDWGWGGWGATTSQGDIARGLGAYASGAGFYNLQSAQANALNLDTVMRWNEYIHQSNREAARLHHERLARERERNTKMRDQIRQRLRDNPERRDVHSGDALNVAMEEINDPRVYTRRLAASQVKIGGALIREIPFNKASAAITVSVYQLVDGGPPDSLKRPEFAALMATIKSLSAELRAQVVADQEPGRATYRKLLATIRQTETKAAEILPRNSRDRTEADRYLKALHGLIGMLNTPAIDVILAGVENRPDTTLGDLILMMNAFSLRFGVATTARQRQVYDTLYPRLVDLRTESARALAAANPVGSVKGAVQDFFSSMSFEDLWKKVPSIF
jgi:hypothetical protein